MRSLAQNRGFYRESKERFVARRTAERSFTINEGNKMPKVINLKEAVEETTRLLVLEKYQTYKHVVTICRKQIAQARILELEQYYGETKDTIASGTGLGEKTIRFWRNGDQDLTLDNLIRLEKYYRMIKRRHGKMVRL